jgi:hypothetical protein
MLPAPKISKISSGNRFDAFLQVMGWFVDYYTGDERLKTA